MPVKVTEGKNSDAYIEVQVGDKTEQFAPQQISRLRPREDESRCRGLPREKIAQAVITVPAYFNDSQRHGHQGRRKIAGLDVLRIINEPTAASLAYGLRQEKRREDRGVRPRWRHVDVSVLEIGDGVFEVKATNGDTHLAAITGTRPSSPGSSTLSKRITASTSARIRWRLQRLKEEAEKAKIALSSTQSVRHQPAVHHGRCVRPEAPSTCSSAAPKWSRSASPFSSGACSPTRTAQGRRSHAGADRRARARRRHTRMPNRSSTSRKISAASPRTRA